MIRDFVSVCFFGGTMKILFNFALALLVSGGVVSEYAWGGKNFCKDDCTKNFDETKCLFYIKDTSSYIDLLKRQTATFTQDGADSYNFWVDALKDACNAYGNKRNRSPAECNIPVYVKAESATPQPANAPVNNLPTGNSNSSIQEPIKKEGNNNTKNNASTSAYSKLAEDFKAQEKAALKEQKKNDLSEAKNTKGDDYFINSDATTEDAKKMQSQIKNGNAVTGNYYKLKINETENGQQLCTVEKKCSSDDNATSEHVDKFKPKDKISLRKDARQEVRRHKKVEEPINKKYNQTESKTDTSFEMMTDTERSWGGKYNTQNFEATDSLNLGVDTARGTMKGAVAGVQQAQASQQQGQMNQKGFSYNNKDAVQMQKDALNKAAKSSLIVGALSNVMGAAQMYQSIKHKKSTKKLDQSKLAAEDTLKKDAFEKSMKGEISIDDARAFYSSNISTNYDGEKKAQNNKAMVQGMTAAGTLSDAGGYIMQAAMLKKMAKGLTATEGNNTGSFNPNFVGGSKSDTSPLQISNTTGGDKDQVVNKPDDKKPDLTNKDSLPNNFGNLPTDSTAPQNPFVLGKQDGSGGGSGGMGAGAGGTSAAQDGAKADQGPGSKSAGGGKYAKGDDGGKKFSRGGKSAGGSEKADPSLSDLLKQFLPKDVGEEQPKGDLASDDRSPASDEVAVMSRDKNIFKEISKRYERKSAEGAVVFQ